MVTIKDIARRANVTDATVSRILNNKAEKHSAKTIEKVWGIAREMGYVVNAMARVTKTGRSKVLGVMGGSVPRELTRGFNHAADERGFLVKSFFITGDEMTSSNAERMVDVVLSQRVDGVIVHCAHKAVGVLPERFSLAGVPCVVSGTGGGLPEDVSCFYSDDEQGGALVADYFQRLGHVNFMCVGSDEENVVETLRLRGFVDRVGGKGGHAQNVRIIARNNAFERVERTRSIFAERGELPLAVFCASSNETINVLTACLAMGLKVPDDVSIAGYCGYTFASTLTPALTTVDECGFARGFEACSHLMDRIESGVAPERRRFAVKLSERDSCAPATLGPR